MSRRRIGHAQALKRAQLHKFIQELDQECFNLAKKFPTRTRVEWVALGRKHLVEHPDRSPDYYVGLLEAMNATLRGAGFPPATMAELKACEHDWDEQPGEPPVDVCTKCGDTRE